MSNEDKKGNPEEEPKELQPDKQNVRGAVKKQPETLCNCPQKCQTKVPANIRLGLYKEFSELADHYRQNQYLQSYIEMRSVYKRLWCQEERVGGRLQRRVSCKYRIPVEIPKQIIHPEDTHQTKLQTNSKGKTTYVVGMKDGIKTIEVCQKAFMNVYGITEKRIRLQREKLIAKLRNDSLEADQTVPLDLRRVVDPLPDVTLTKRRPYDNMMEPNDELSIVDTFFRNQLWRPEYIGIPCDKLRFLDVYHNDVKA